MTVYESQNVTKFYVQNEVAYNLDHRVKLKKFLSLYVWLILYATLYFNDSLEIYFKCNILHLLIIIDLADLKHIKQYGWLSSRYHLFDP